FGTLGDVGAQALAKSAHVRGLKRLDLTWHYIGDEWQKKLQQLPIVVELDDPQEEDDDMRFVKVSE
ncbi:MAG TPA: hypothetical protein VFO79_15850, partial [Xanthomonadales bacterium]|nr:hypothetical protein [Xanthomonadales bacterium]